MKNRSLAQGNAKTAHLKLKRQTIGVFNRYSSRAEQGYIEAILTGIKTAVYEHNLNLLNFTGGSLSTSSDPAFNKQRNILYALASPANVDGLLIIDTVGDIHSPQALAKLHQQKSRVPTVSIGAAIAGVPSLIVDNKTGLQDALVHLIEAHHYRKIAIIRGPDGNKEAAERYQIYKEVLASYKLPIDPNLITQGDYSVASGANAVHTLLEERKVDFDAILAINDNMALGAIEALQIAGQVVPYDVAVIGIDDITQAQFSLPPLTTVHQPLLELGQQAVQQLLNQLANKPNNELTVLPTSMVVRRSCGCIDKDIIATIPDTLSNQNNVTEDHLLQALATAIPSQNKAISASINSWATQCLDSFLSDSKGETTHQFLSTLDQLIRLLIKDNDDISPLQKVIFALQSHLSALFANDKQLAQARMLLHQAQAFITKEALSYQQQQRLQIEYKNSLLHAVAQSLSSTLEVDKIIAVLAENLSLLGISSFYLVLYEDTQPYRYPQTHPAWSRLHLAYEKENGRISLPNNHIRFPTEHLLPNTIIPADKQQIMRVEALFFQSNQIGYILLSQDDDQSHIFETLRGQISTALNGALLLQKKNQIEEELRQQQIHLDKLVYERTAELQEANLHLQQQIHKRKQIEEQTRFQATLLKNVSDAIISTDLQWHVTSWNREAEALYGFKVEEVLGKPLVDIINPIYATGSRDDMLRTFIENEKWEGEVIHHHKDKTPIHIWGSLSTIKTTTGENIGAVSVNRNITQQKEAEEALKHTVTLLKNVINASQDFIFVKDTNLRTILCNDVFALAAGKSPEALYGKTDIENGWHPELVKGNPEKGIRGFEVDDREVLAGKTIRNSSDPANVDGEIRIFDTIKTPVRDELGNITGILGVSRDITDRKVAEEALRASQHNLAYAQKIAKVAYFNWDLSTNAVSWSDEMYRIFGLDQATFKPEVNTFSNFLHPDDLYLVSDENFAKMMADKTHHMEFRIYDQTTNELKHLFLWGETTFSEEGVPLSIFGIIQDITERRNAEIQLESYAAELERSNQDLQEFAYVASHDLQEPLRKIQAFGDRLQLKYSHLLDERGINYIHRMQNAASRMQVLIVDLLAFSRVHTHTHPFNNINLNQVIHNILQNLEVSIAEKDADIVCDTLPEIEADVVQIRQLFQNLLSNALKFSRPNVPLTIQITHRIEKNLCEISIRDNGIGFEEKYLDRIFTVFERLHTRSEYPGTGIGLAICRRIVERHHGSISAKSQLGQGATFIIKLPITQEPT